MLNGFVKEVVSTPPARLLIISLECRISSAAETFPAVTQLPSVRMLAHLRGLVPRDGRGCSMRLTDGLPAFLMLVLSLCAGPFAYAAEDQFLPPEQVFRYTVTSDGASAAVHWNLPPGYYAYKARMSLQSGTPGLTLGSVVYPKGEIHQDDYFGAQEIFRGAFVVTTPITLAPGAPAET